MRAVFRSDASYKIGGGHVMRCLTLARALEVEGWQCCFAVGDQTLETVPALGKAGYEFLVLNKTLDEALQMARQWGTADLLVIDHFYKGIEFETPCRSFARRILVVDDLADRPHDCDILLDHTPGRQGIDYQFLTPKGCQFLIGPTYALISSDYATIRPVALERRRKAAGPLRIHINFGAVDLYNMTTRALDGITESGIDCEIDIVLGATAKHLEDIRNIADRAINTITVHEWVEEMAALLAKSDLAIGAVGVTALERACLGLPSLIVVAANNQKLISHGLEQAGAVVNLGWYEDVTKKTIADVLVSNDLSLAKMSTNAAALCDGLGAKRIAMAINPA